LTQLDGAYCNALLLAHWSVHQKLNHVSSVTSLCAHLKKVKSGTCYSASYRRRTHGQKRFITFGQVADWHELMIPQCTMQPSIASISKQLDP